MKKLPKKCRKLLLVLSAALLLSILLSAWLVFGYEKEPAEEPVATVEPVQATPSPTPVPTPEPTEPPAEAPADFAEWQGVNEDIFGWIEVPDTNISYPTLQSKTDDSFYLTHHFDGTYNSFGSIFSQYTYNTVGFVDRVTMLYGHDIWTNDLYFHQLHKFSDDDFFASHSEIYTYTPGEKQTWEIVEWVTLDDRHVMYSFNLFQNAEDVQSFFDEMNASTQTKCHEDVLAKCDENTQYLFLSTCHPTISNERCILVCRLEKTQPAVYSGEGIHPEDIPR